MTTNESKFLKNLNCIVCEKSFELCLHNTIYPATIFRTTGNYGSTIIDMDPEIEIVICDYCLAKNRKFIYEYSREDNAYQKPEYEYGKHVSQLIDLYGEIKDHNPNEKFILNSNSGEIERFISEEEYLNFWRIHPEFEFEDIREYLKFYFKDEWLKYSLNTVSDVLRYFN